MFKKKRSPQSRQQNLQCIQFRQRIEGAACDVIKGWPSSNDPDKSISKRILMTKQINTTKGNKCITFVTSTSRGKAGKQDWHEILTGW
jgi:hypothetical protein